MTAQTATLIKGRLQTSESVAAVAIIALALSVIGFLVSPESFFTAVAISAALGFVIGGNALYRYGSKTVADDARSFKLIGGGVQAAGAWMIVSGVAAEFHDLPAFGLIDLVFLAAFGVMLAGLAMFPTVNRGWRSQARILIDGLVGAISIGVLLWNGALQPILDEIASLSPLAQVIGLAYPVLDVSILVGIMVVALRRGQYRFDIRLVTLSIAFAFQALGDLGFLANSSDGLLATVSPFILLFAGSSAAVLVTGLLVHRRPAPLELADRNTPVWSYALPYAAGFMMIGLHVYQTATTGDSHLVGEIATLTVLMLVIGRQSLAIHENQTKVELERRSLVASVSHELRTPLTSLIGFLSLLEDDGAKLSDSERSDIAGVILEQANYMGRMVTDMVILARDDPQQMALNPTDVTVAPFIAASVDMATTRGRHIKVECDSDLVARMDEDRMQQVLVNLLTNAVRYGGDSILLSVGSRDDDLRIEVHDNGPGIPKKYEQRIWDRFERGPNQLNATVPGTGLGLAIVEMIVRAHGGQATYRLSERTGGAAFEVILPRAVVRDSTVNRPLLPVSSRSQ